MLKKLTEIATSLKKALPTPENKARKRLFTAIYHYSDDRKSLGQTAYLTQIKDILKKHPEAIEWRNEQSSRNKGNTPLLAACGSFWKEGVIRLLCEAGADINVRDNQGQTPLMYLAQPPWVGTPFEGIPSTQEDRDYTVRMVAYLLKKGADPTCVDNGGNTALHGAVCYLNLYSMKVLLNKAVGNHLPVNHQGETPLDMVSKHLRAGLQEELNKIALRRERKIVRDAKHLNEGIDSNMVAKSVKTSLRRPTSP